MVRNSLSLVVTLVVFERILMLLSIITFSTFSAKTFGAMYGWSHEIWWKIKREINIQERTKYFLYMKRQLNGG